MQKAEQEQGQGQEHEQEHEHGPQEKESAFPALLPAHAADQAAVDHEVLPQPIELPANHRRLQHAPAERLDVKRSGVDIRPLLDQLLGGFARLGHRCLRTQRSH